MIRTFAKCGNTMERIHFLQSLKEEEYTLDDLHNLCDIMSFEAGALAKESLKKAMIDELKARIVAEGYEAEKISRRISGLDEELPYVKTGIQQLNPDLMLIPNSSF
ncbi:hypothetical protein GPL15_26715 [Clostridium sp. MCC353]|uniref:hypothetical protein n=1 Tax=Clostridium sp. MCC353 TaxID=2592646 RepID=UPI001C02A436|nr:hypothetical protein [Clostridium sp. MCC353]MBT9780064.1 hypothetical protein [Clostridium sp. MCC353]